MRHLSKLYKDAFGDPATFDIVLKAWAEGRSAHRKNDSTDGKSVFYHNNEIVRGTPQSFEITFAGWQTPTTKARLNMVLGKFAKDYDLNFAQNRIMLRNSTWSEGQEKWENHGRWIIDKDAYIKFDGGRLATEIESFDEESHNKQYRQHTKAVNELTNLVYEIIVLKESRTDEPTDEDLTQIQGKLSQVKELSANLGREISYGEIEDKLRVRRPIYGMGKLTEAFSDDSNILKHDIKYIIKKFIFTKEESTEEPEVKKSLGKITDEPNIIEDDDEHSIRPRQAICLECGEKFIQDRDIQLCDKCIDKFDLDLLWAKNDEGELDALDFNESEKMREQFRKTTMQSSKKIAQDEEEPTVEEEAPTDEEKPQPDAGQPDMGGDMGGDEEELDPNQPAEGQTEKPEVTPELMKKLTPMDSNLLAKLEHGYLKALTKGDVITMDNINLHIKDILTKYLSPSPVNEMSPESFVARKMQTHTGIRRDYFPLMAKASQTLKELQHMFHMSIGSVGIVKVSTDDWSPEPKSGWVEWVVTLRRLGSNYPGRRAIIRINVVNDKAEFIPIIWDMMGNQYNLDTDGVEAFLGTKYDKSIIDLEKSYMKEEADVRKALDKKKLDTGVYGLGTQPITPSDKGVSAPKTNVGSKKTANRIANFLQRTQEKLKAKTPEELAKAEKGVIADDDYEVIQYQQTQSQAFASGLLSQDEAQLLYMLIGGNIPTAEKFNKQPLATRMTVMVAIDELAEKIISKRKGGGKKVADTPVVTVAQKSQGKNCQDSFWYEGHLITVSLGDREVEIYALGKIRIHDKEGNLVHDGRVRDNGFPEFPKGEPTTDEELSQITDYGYEWVNNNWFEYIMIEGREEVNNDVIDANYDDLVSIAKDIISGDDGWLSPQSKEGSKKVADKVKCPNCGIPTIEDKEGLTEEEMLCEKCYKEKYGSKKVARDKKSLITYWDVSEMSEALINDMMKEPDNDDWIMEMEVDFKIPISGEEVRMDLTTIEEQYGHEAMLKALNEDANARDEISTLVYNDSDYFEMTFEDEMNYLTEVLNKKNPDNLPWDVRVENFGWRNLSGSTIVNTNDGREFLQKVLPKTDCSFYIYENGKDGIKIQNYHHDSPMGNEWYYAKPTKENIEEYASKKVAVKEQYCKSCETRFYDKPLITECPVCRAGEDNIVVVDEEEKEASQKKATKYCQRCGNPVQPETDPELKKEYPYYCPECDENMYGMEVTDKPDTKSSKTALRDRPDPKQKPDFDSNHDLDFYFGDNDDYHVVANVDVTWTHDPYHNVWSPQDINVQSYEVNDVQYGGNKGKPLNELPVGVDEAIEEQVNNIEDVETYTPDYDAMRESREENRREREGTKNAMSENNPTFLEKFFKNFLKQMGNDTQRAFQKVVRMYNPSPESKQELVDRLKAEGYQVDVTKASKKYLSNWKKKAENKSYTYNDDTHFEIMIEYHGDDEAELPFHPGELYDVDEDEVYGGAVGWELADVLKAFEDNDFVGDTIIVKNTDSGEIYEGWGEVRKLKKIEGKS